MKYSRCDDFTLDEIMTLTHAHSPDLSVAQASKDVAVSQVEVAKSRYLPTLNLDAIDSTGFPGSSGLTGVSGLMGSPYRSGLAVGVTLEQTLWDFGQTGSLVELEKARIGVASAEVELSKFRVDSAVIRAFFECELFRSQKESWEHIRKESEIIANEVGRFVKTGQRSIVEKYLVDAQTEEALTNESSYSEHYKASIHLLSLVAGKELEKSCPVVTAQADKVPRKKEDQVQNPMIQYAKEELGLAKLAVDQAKTRYLPRLVGVGSFGEMEKSRFVPKQDFSVAVGLVFPLFDGFKTKNQIRSAEAYEIKKEKELELSNENYQKLVLRYDDAINSSRIRFLHLQKELDLAEKGFRIAKERYFSFKGSLIDIREALRNVARTKTQLNEAATELSISTTIQNLL